MRLRSHLTLLVVAAVLPVIIFAGGITYLSLRQQRENLTHGLIERARAISAALDREFLISIQSLKVLGASTHLDKGDLAEFHGEMKRALTAYSRSWQNLTLLDSSGQQLINLRHPFGSALPQTGNPEEIERARQTKEAVIADLSPGPVTGAPGIVVHVPVTKDGRVKYFLNAIFYSAPLTDLLLQQKLPAGWFAAIIDRSQVIAARIPDIEKFLGKPASSIFAAQARQFREATWRETTLEGVAVVSALHRSDFTGWTVGVGIPASMFEASPKRSLMILAGGGLLLLLSGISLALLIGFRITRSIAEISAGAVALGKGEAPRFKASRITEINQAARSVAEAGAQRMQFEKALKYSEERKGAILESALDAIVTMDDEGRTVDFNPAAERIFGYAHGEAIGKPLADLIIPPKLREHHYRGLARYLSTREGSVLGKPIEMAAMRSDGSEFPVELSITVLGVRGRPMFTGHIRDITNLKQAEEALRERIRLAEFRAEIGLALVASDELRPILQKCAEAMVRHLDAAFARIWTLDSNGTVLELQASAGMYTHIDGGHSRVSVGKFKIGLIAQERKPHLTNAVIGDPRVHDQEWAKQEGMVAFAGYPLLVSDRPVGVMAMFARKPLSDAVLQDMSLIANEISVGIERKRAEDRALRNYHRIRALHEIDTAISSTLNLKQVLELLLGKSAVLRPGCASVVRLFNRESGVLERTACYNLDEEQWRVRQSVGPTFSSQVVERNAAVTVVNLQIDPQSVDREYFRRQGLFSYLGVPLKVKGDCLGVLAFYTKEIHEFTTEEIEFAATLAGQAAIAIHNAQLFEGVAESNKIKSEFLSVMSHELRTPLNVIMGNIGLVAEGLFGQITPDQAKALQKAQSHSQELLDMVNTILQATQMEAKEVRVDLSTISLGHVLDDLKCTFDLQSKNLKLLWDCPSDLPVIKSDRTRLTHVLRNLINNALKFTEKGTVTISVRVSSEQQTIESSTPNHVPAAGKKRWVKFTVTDTGVGIAPHQLPIIFDIFRQIDSSETRRYGGTGLGLYIVKKYTELLGGTVEVESDLGKGSTFTVTLPAFAP